MPAAVFLGIDVEGLACLLRVCRFRSWKPLNGHVDFAAHFEARIGLSAGTERGIDRMVRRFEGDILPA